MEQSVSAQQRVNSYTVKRLLNICLLLSSLIGYMEWGKGFYAFTGLMEYQLFRGELGNLETALHPMVLAPIAGQVIILLTVFQKKPNTVLTLMGLGCMGLIMLLLFVIGVMKLNYKIILAALPFVFTAVAIFWQNRKWTPGGDKRSALSSRR